MYSPTLSLTSAQKGWVVNTTPRPFYPQEETLSHSTGGWVGPRVGLNWWRKSRPYWDSIAGSSRS